MRRLVRKTGGSLNTIDTICSRTFSQPRCPGRRTRGESENPRHVCRAIPYLRDAWLVARHHMPDPACVHIRLDAAQTGDRVVTDRDGSRSGSPHVLRAQHIRDGCGGQDGPRARGQRCPAAIVDIISFGGEA